MLKEIIDNINEKLFSLGLLKMYGLCEIIEHGGVRFPAEYCLNKFHQISDFDKYRGSVYHRITGSMSTSPIEDEYSACNIYLKKVYPLTMVICVSKDIFGNSNNDAYFENEISSTIECLISESNNKLSKTLGAESISVYPKSINTDRYSVFKREYYGIEMKIPFEYAYLSIDYSVEVIQKNSCIKKIQCK